MKTKILSICHIIFLGLIMLSALHYFDIGQWKAEVAWFGIVEALVIILSAILFAIKKTRTLKYVYAFLGIMQVFPMAGAFIILGKYMFYGVFHLLMISWCVFSLIFMARKKNIDSMI